MKQANALANGVRLPERRSIAGEILPVVTPPGRIGQITLAAATRSSSGHLKDAYHLGCLTSPDSLCVPRSQCNGMPLGLY